MRIGKLPYVGATMPLLIAVATARVVAVATARARDGSPSLCSTEDTWGPTVF
jgi:hypothetical protein